VGVSPGADGVERLRAASTRLASPTYNGPSEARRPEPRVAVHLQQVFPQVFGKYILERPLAAGGMARVYLATLRGAGGFEKRLVVKQIRAELATDEAFVRRFVTEAKTTVELAHPNIVPVYELGVEQGVYYLAMELCDGVTLAELLERGGPLSIEEGAYVAVEVCRALDYAHRKASVVHRDVTPRNIIVDEEGGVRLIDFGIAAKAHAGPREVFGSPGHMPPEQLRGDAVGPPADVFAVAAALYEAWSGVAPFRRADDAASALALARPVRPPSQLSPALERAAPLDAHVLAALAENPRDRPQSAEDFARPLRRFMSERDVGDVARELAERVRRVRRQRSVRPPPDSSPQAVPPAPPAHPGATRTFAVREGTPAMSTRRMAEDPATWSAARLVKNAPRSSQNRLIVRSAALLVSGLLALWVWSRDSPVNETSRAAALSATAALTTSDAPASAIPIFASANPIPASAALLPSSSAPVTTAHSASLPRSAAIEHARAHLRVLASPAASVEVDGRARGSAPLPDLALAPGNHTLRLYCSALDETLLQQIALLPGELVTVSADFTATRGRLIVRHATR
jgi:serine/threonine protein kinase